MSPCCGRTASTRPAPVVERPHREIVAAVRNPDTTRRIVDGGGVAVGDTPQEFAAVIASEAKRWGEVVRAAGVKPD
jgi:tripartite-type tricarboxylate transporter receptor subunit TctC